MEHIGQALGLSKDGSRKDASAEAEVSADKELKEGEGGGVGLIDEGKGSIAKGKKESRESQD